MSFGFYRMPGLRFFAKKGNVADEISRVSKSVAAGVFTLGLVLIGFGFLIYLFPRVFATVAAIVFFAAGIGCSVAAIKIYLIQRRLGKINSDDSEAYRNNVQIHIEEDFDV